MTTIFLSRGKKKLDERRSKDTFDPKEWSLRRCLLLYAAYYFSSETKE